MHQESVCCLLETETGGECGKGFQGESMAKGPPGSVSECYWERARQAKSNLSQGKWASFSRKNLEKDLQN